jgi:hypothetical protein
MHSFRPYFKLYDLLPEQQPLNGYRTKMDSPILSQPYFWKSGRMTLTLPKWGLGSLLGLPKLQSSIAGVKTPHIEVFFISLKSY